MQRWDDKVGWNKAQRARCTIGSHRKGQPCTAEQHRSGGAVREVLLRHMTPRQRGVILRIAAHGELGRRIRDMGLVPGTAVEVQGRAPLKDPVAIRVRDFTLSLRNSEADQIVVGVEELT